MRGIRLLVLAIFLVAGCTFSSVKSRDTRSPGPPKHVLIMGRVAMPTEPDRAPWKASWPQHQPQFDTGVREWLERNRSDWAFASLDEGQPLPPGSIILTGTITSMSYGIGALRFWIGMGAGQEKVSGDFELHAADGRLLSRFHARESYLGGVGIGGALVLPLLLRIDYMSMDTVVRRFAETVAEKAVKVVAPKATAEAR